MANRIYPTNFFIGFEERTIREVGLESSIELTVLSAIRALSLEDTVVRPNGPSYKEIKLSVDCSHENLSKSLKALEGSGLLRREKDVNDGRVVRYRMTPDAWKLISTADNFITQEIMRYVVDNAFPE